MEYLKNLQVERDIPATMRDGVVLYADIYRPRGEGPFPVIMLRLPYDKTKAEVSAYSHPSWYAQRGYIVVVQDTRGRWASGGEFYPFRYEMQDGYDSVEWAARLPGSNGRVGMYGFSYPGATQLLAAIMRPPHLACICPGLTSSQYFEGWAYNGGAFALAFNMSWAISLSIESAHRRGLADLEQALWYARRNPERFYGDLPLGEFALLKRDNIAPYFFDWLRHDSYDEYWKEWSVDRRYQAIEIPALHIGGWYDIFRDGTLKNFVSLREEGATEQVRRNQKLLMGPWMHANWGRHVGPLDFGPEARNIVDEVQLRWFDYWLKGIDNGVMDDPAVEVFVMGSNSWLTSDRWPPDGVQFVDFYLHSQDRANSLNGDGTLDATPPGEESPDIYVYDPRAPVPSIGGHSCCAPGATPMGPADQRDVEIMNQVLVYTSAPLQEDLAVIGPVTATLWAASSAVDTDFTVKLVDVYPDGRAINVTEGIIRARYRDSLESPSLLEPGEIYRFTVDVGQTAIVFKAGHCIRVEVSSSNYPHWDRNTNTGRALGVDSYADIVVATQALFHDAARPSHITLPVLGRR